ncbi:ionotropic receptor 25a-like [Haliotis cracherodii]|uniref:ionotropic receptor 25a-like n=1 Tax=Haliotis cracherodii TaxID=6455 RepID=UPI0039ED54FD
MFSVLLATVLVGLAHSGSRALSRKIVVLVDRDLYADFFSRDLSSLLSVAYNVSSSEIRTYRMNNTNTPLHISSLCGKYREDIVVILDTTASCTFANVAATLFRHYVRVSNRKCNGQKVINIRPDLTFYSEAALSFTDLGKTTVARTVFLYDDIFGNDSIPDLLYHELPNALIRKMMVMTSARSLKAWVTQLASKKILRYIVAVGTKSSLQTLFEMACRDGVPDTFHWVVVLTDALQLNMPACPFKHLVIFRHRLTWTNVPGVEINSSVDTGFLIDGLTTAMLLASNQGDDDWIKPCSEISFSKEDNTSGVQSGKYPGVIGNISSTPSRTETMVLEILQHNYLKTKPTEIGTWSRQSSIQLHNASTQGHKRPNVVVVTKHEPPFVIREETENGTQYTGFSMDVFKEISRRLDLDFTVYEPRDGQYGKQNPDGTWTGLMGEILTGYADIAVASMSMTTERDMVADFTTPYYEFGGFQILIKNNNPGTSLLAFANVFSGEVWACWASVLLLSGLLVCVFERLSPFSPYNKDQHKARKKFTVKEGLWLVTASFPMAGPECTPRTFSTRMLVGGFWFFCSIMMATYTANLAAFLTTSRLSVPIESLDDLAKQNTIKYSVVQGTVIHEYFQRMAKIESDLYQEWKSMSFYTKNIDTSRTVPANYAVWDYPLGDKYLTIWRSIQKTGLINNTREGIAKVLAGNFALIHESPMIQYELSKHCDLLAVGKQFSSRSYAFALAEGSPLTRIISYTILQLQSETILETMKTKWWKNGNLTCSQVDESGGLTFHTVGGIFVVASVGIGLGVIALGLERLWASLTRVPKEQHNTSLNGQTNLAADFNPGISYLAKEFYGEEEGTADIDAITLEMARMY